MLFSTSTTIFIPFERIESNFDENGNYAGPPVYTCEECKAFNSDDSRIILPVLVDSIFAEIEELRKSDVLCSELQPSGFIMPRNEDDLVLRKTIWTLITTTDKVSRCQYPTETDHR